MQTAAFLLAAGHGRRMGPVGRVLPKPLWPIGSRSLLELQLAAICEQGLKRVFINLFHGQQAVAQHLQDSPLIQSLRQHQHLSIETLKEPQLLGTGGAVHNLLAHFPEVTSLFLINCDQFLWGPQGGAYPALVGGTQVRAKLAATLVTEGPSYRETQWDSEHRLYRIAQAPADRPYFTYAGQGIVHLAGLAPSAGFSSLFETVANYREETIQMHAMGPWDYWDFGTLEHWRRGLKKLSEVPSSDPFKKFFQRHGGGTLGPEGLARQSFVWQGQRFIL